MAARRDDRIDDIVKALDRFVLKIDDFNTSLNNLRSEFAVNSSGLELLRKSFQDSVTDIKGDIRALQNGLNDSAQKNHEEIDALRREVGIEIKKVYEVIGEIKNDGIFFKVKIGIISGIGGVAGGWAIVWFLSRAADSIK